MAGLHSQAKWTGVITAPLNMSLARYSFENETARACPFYDAFSGRWDSICMRIPLLNSKGTPWEPLASSTRRMAARWIYTTMRLLFLFSRRFIESVLVWVCKRPLECFLSGSGRQTTLLSLASRSVWNWAFRNAVARFSLWIRRLWRNSTARRDFGSLCLEA